MVLLKGAHRLSYERLDFKARTVDRHHALYWPAVFGSRIPVRQVVAVIIIDIDHSSVSKITI